MTKLMKNIISMQKECAGYCSVVVFHTRLCYPDPRYTISRHRCWLETLFLYHHWRMYFIIYDQETNRHSLFVFFACSIPFSALSDSIWYSVRSMLLIGVYLLLFLSIASILQFFLPSFLILPFQLIAEFSSGVLLCATLSLPIKINCSLRWLCLLLAAYACTCKFCLLCSITLFLI